MSNRTAWNKGLTGDEYKKHYVNGFKGTFKKGQRPSKDTEFKKGSPKLKNAYSFPKGKDNPRYNQGIHISRGYNKLFLPNHPNCDSKGYYWEHRYVIEQNLGRLLTKIEVVHHIDGNKQNNSLDNLQIFKDTAEHSKLHCELRRGLN